MRMADAVHIYSALPVSLHYIIHQNYEGATIVLRYISVACAVLSIPLIYLLGVRMHSKATGLLAAAIWAVSPWVVYMSKMATPYPLILLILLATVAMTFKVVDEISARKGPEPFTWGQFFIMLVIVSYIHPAGAMLAGLLVLGIFGFALGHRSSLTSSITLSILLLSVNLPNLLFIPGRRNVYISDLMETLTIKGSVLWQPLPGMLLVILCLILVLAFVQIVILISRTENMIKRYQQELMMLVFGTGLVFFLIVMNGLFTPIPWFEIVVLVFPFFILLTARAITFFANTFTRPWLISVLMILVLGVSTMLVV